MQNSFSNKLICFQLNVGEEIKSTLGSMAWQKLFQTALKNCSPRQARFVSVDFEVLACATELKVNVSFILQVDHQQDVQ